MRTPAWQTVTLAGKGTTLKYRADIDGLRAIAVLLVLVFHFDLLGLGQAGFIGVDLFFVISGYLISRIVWRDLEAGEFSLGHFYARRVRRLAPALIAVQLLVLSIATFLLLPAEILSLSRESMATQLYVSNIYYWKTLNYFGLHAGGAFMLHTWSLGVEEQFYLFYPLFLMGIYRWARRHLLAVLIALFVTSFLLNIAFVGTKPEAAFYLLPTRAWELAAGALLTFIEPTFRQSPVARAAAAPAALLLLVVAVASYGPGTPFPGWFALLPVAAGSLLLLAGTGDGSIVSKALSLPVATFFGRISYPLYLIHWPLNVFGLVLLPRYSLPLRWAFFGLSIVIAFAVTRLIEEPVRRGRWLATDRKLIAAYFVSLVFILLLVGSISLSGGWRARFSGSVLRVADTTDDFDLEARRWEFQDGDALDTRLRPIGAHGTKPTWLIYGDSHAGALAEAFSLWLGAHNQAGEVTYHSGCMPLLDSGTAGCRVFNRQALKHAAGRNVILVSIWRQPLEAGYRGRNGDILEGDAAKSDYSEAIRRTVIALRAAGARVRVWEPLPAAAHAVPEAMARSMILGSYWPVDTSLRQHRQEMGFVAAALDRAGVPKRDRIDPAIAICPTGRCFFTLDGLPLYSDNNHPTHRSAPWFAAVIGKEWR